MNANEEKTLVVESRRVIRSLRRYFSNDESLSLRGFDRLLCQGQDLLKRLENKASEQESQRAELIGIKSELKRLLSNEFEETANVAVTSNLYGSGSSALFSDTGRGASDNKYSQPDERHETFHVNTFLG